MSFDLLFKKYSHFSMILLKIRLKGVLLLHYPLFSKFLKKRQENQTPDIQNSYGMSYNSLKQFQIYPNLQSKLNKKITIVPFIRVRSVFSKMQIPSPLRSCHFVSWLTNTMLNGVAKIISNSISFSHSYNQRQKACQNQKLFSGRLD